MGLAGMALHYLLWPQRHGLPPVDDSQVAKKAGRLSAELRLVCHDKPGSPQSGRRHRRSHYGTARVCRPDRGEGANAL